MDDPWTTSVDLHLDLPDGAGRRAGLEEALRAAVRDGRLPAGARVPSSRALAAELGVARGTVTAAYDQLAAEGYLVPGRGSGTVVADLSAVLPRAGAAPSSRWDVTRADLDLTPGSPDVGSFPVSAWVRSVRRALDTAPPSALDYGDPRGQRVLREELAGYLGRTRGVRCTPDDVVVVSGAVQGLALLARVAGSGPVAMEDPGLPFHREVVRGNGRAVLPLRVDEYGARTDLLAGTAADVAVLTPAHQYPLGVPLAARRRQDLLVWARDGGLAVEDDYDGEFRYDRQPVGAVQGIAPDAVAYLGSAAKTLAPGLRLAWLVLPPRLRDDVVEAKRLADLGSEAVAQLALADLIATHGYDRHVRATRLRYRRRRDLLLEVLGRRAGRQARSHVPRSIAAGLQTVVRLPADPGEEPVLRRAAERGLALGGLAEHSHDGAGEPGLVVGFARPRDAAYPRALEALASVLP